MNGPTQNSNIGAALSSSQCNLEQKPGTHKTTKLAVPVIKAAGGIVVQLGTVMIVLTLVMYAIAISTVAPAFGLCCCSRIGIARTSPDGCPYSYI